MVKDLMTLADQGSITIHIKLLRRAAQNFDGIFERRSCQLVCAFMLKCPKTAGQKARSLVMICTPALVVST